MNIRYEIDNRETKLIELINDESFIVKPLDIGDIQITLEEHNKTFVFERKTISDLESSIKDGRWQEQKMRCIASGFNIFYIIESWSANVMKTNPMVTSAVINLLLTGPIKVIFTSNTNDTALFIKMIKERITKNPQKYVADQPDLCYEKCLSIKQKKKDNVTNKHILIQQLCAYPGISWKKASTIVEHFNIETFGELYEQLKKNPETLTDCKGIGKQLATSLHNHMFR